jgi:peroxiredoxin
MKLRFILLVVCASACITGCTQKDTIEIPLTIQDGYGPFKMGMGGIAPDSEDENDPWRKTRLQVSGIPGDWTEAKKGDININIYQTVYQNYLQGNISPEWYEKLQASWDWVPDTVNLSKTPLKTKIAFAFGKDSAGEIKMVVDANNNQDFSDDVIFSPVELDFNSTPPNRDSLASVHSLMVTYERLSGDRILQEQVPLFIAHVHPYDLWMCSFPQHLTATFEGKELAITGGFTDLLYHRTKVVPMNDSLRNGKKVTEDDLISGNDYLSLGEKIYKYKGINTNKNVMILEKIDLPKEQLYSTQAGFKAIPFEGQDFRTKAPVSLDDYRGKYVYLDFWAVWCGPCIQEFPNLKTLYDNLDHSQFEILGIVGDSPADALDETITRHDITWPQILSDEANTIKQKYGIHGYPTTFLIDLNGVIVAKNLRGKDLEDKIKEIVLSLKKNV